ncbi:MAG: peptidylprolyl isomerase, partial [Phycisphaerales bacterium]|nr:peptidylprolyl isomerase [Phycisphaerales bacterium]
AVFGKVIKGMDVVDVIRKAKTGSRGHYGDVPVETIVIEKVSVLSGEKAEELGLVGADG